MPSIQSDPGSPVEYSYRPSLFGAACRFVLREDGLEWQIGRASGITPYDRIARITLSFRPMSMQSRRYQVAIRCRDGRRFVIMSATWRTVALVAPQDESYRVFVRALHERAAASGAAIEFRAGLQPAMYGGVVAMVSLVAFAMVGLFVRAIMQPFWTAALFVAGFAALFVWQIGGYVLRNRPRSYSAGDIPQDLLP